MFATHAVGALKRDEPRSRLPEEDSNFGESLEICLIAVVVEFAMPRGVEMQGTLKEMEKQANAFSPTDSLTNSG